MDVPRFHNKHWGGYIYAMGHGRFKMKYFFNKIIFFLLLSAQSHLHAISDFYKNVIFNTIGEPSWLSLEIERICTKNMGTLNDLIKDQV